MIRPVREFVSCDWGTSNFRLRVVESETLEILDGLETDMGVRKLDLAFKSQSEIGRRDFFADYLSRQLEKLNFNEDAEPIVVASGMASSSIGLLELPYSQVPFDISGRGVSTRKIAFKSGVTLLLVSGVKSHDNVMRGEETQAIGLSEILPLGKKCILLLPGTHSKHLEFDKQQIVNFRTFMTGELFDLLTSQSILCESITRTAWQKCYTEVFLEGVQQGANGRLPETLFSIRARDLLGQRTHDENGHFLSGLLIGSELAWLVNRADPVILAATAKLFPAYELALNTLLPRDRVICHGEDILENALLAGQRKLLQANI
jgi:2-dehydro-3-deoxygalactonokinase